LVRRGAVRRGVKQKKARTVAREAGKRKYFLMDLKIAP
jgi:hypothetical protein